MSASILPRRVDRKAFPLCFQIKFIAFYFVSKTVFPFLKSEFAHKFLDLCIVLFTFLGLFTNFRISLWDTPRVTAAATAVAAEPRMIRVGVDAGRQLFHEGLAQEGDADPRENENREAKKLRATNESGRSDDMVFWIYCIKCVKSNARVLKKSAVNVQRTLGLNHRETEKRLLTCRCKAEGAA